MLFEREACECCGTPFIGRHSANKRFCSALCRSRVYAHRERTGKPRPRLSELAVGLDQVAVAWVAGIVEGEGSLHRNRKVRNGTTYVYPAVRVAMTDEDVVRRLQTITGLGRITGPHLPPSRDAHHKPHFQWSVGRTDEALTLIAMIWPHLGERRRGQASRLLGEMRAA